MLLEKRKDCPIYSTVSYAGYDHENKEVTFMPQKFKTGDQVKLKSGGAVMTVREYYSDNKVICNWQDAKKKACQEEYLEDQLELYDPEDDAPMGFVMG